MANNKAYQEALKQLENMLSNQKALKKSAEDLNNSWNAIASEIFKLDGAQFFKEVEKSPEQLKKMGDEVRKLEETFKSLGDEFSEALNKDEKIKSISTQLRGVGDDFKASSKQLADILNTKFASISSSLDVGLRNVIRSEQDLQDILQGRKKITEDQLKSLQKIQDFHELEIEHNKLNTKYQEDLSSKLSMLKKENSEIALLSDQAISNVMSQLAAGKPLVDILAKATEEEKKFIGLLSESPEKIKEITRGMNMANQSIIETRKSATELNKEFSLSKGLVSGLKSAVGGIGSIIKKDWVGAMSKFDEVLNKVQKDTSINMDLNSEGFARLQTDVAQFGMSVEGAGAMLKDMSSELRSTDFAVLSQATKDFASIEGATGAASSDITNIAGELMRMGESSGQVKDLMEGADQAARQFGISSSKVIGGISRNIKKVREMGFVNGEKSLTKMALTAERLRMNMDETFDMAKKARNIEGALNMAAELQLAGGSFANINPMDLLAAARKGPAELQKILTTMGKDIGHFSKETGKYEFDPIDADRLQMVADATGQSMESLQNMIQKNAEDTEKLTPFQGMMDGLEDADQELAKSSLSQMLKMGKDGKIEFDAGSDMAKKMGIDSLEELQSMSGKDLTEKLKADQQSLEEQNKNNQSLKQSFDNFINALMSIFSFFQPALEVLTKVMQGVTSVFSTLMGWAPGWMKALLGGLILFGVMFSSSVGAFITQGIGGFLKGVGGFAKSTFDFVKNITSGKGMEALGSLGKGVKDKFMGKAAEGTADIAKNAAIKATGGAAESVGQSTSALTTSKISSKIDMGGLLKFSAAMALIGAAVMMFGVGINQMGGIDMLDILGKGAIAIGLLALAVFGIGKIASGIDLGGVVKFSLAMTLVGVALIPFAFAAQMLTGIDWMSVLAGIGVLTLVVFGLMGLGMLMAGPQILFLLIGVGILIAVGAALLVAASGLLLAAEAFNQLGAVNWSGFSEMGSALMSVIPGMLGFAFASLAFANPITLIGMLMMASVLGGLVSVMSPLAESLTLGADSLDRFASGLEKLSTAADKLSLDKLEKLKELSDALAKASSSATVAGALANGSGAGSDKSKSDGEVRKIIVDVKLNGRELQNFIVKDTSILK